MDDYRHAFGKGYEEVYRHDLHRRLATKMGRWDSLSIISTTLF
jgi:hypothetical protein